METQFTYTALVTIQPSPINNGKKPTTILIRGGGQKKDIYNRLIIVHNQYASEKLSVEDIIIEEQDNSTEKGCLYSETVQIEFRIDLYFTDSTIKPSIEQYTRSSRRTHYLNNAKEAVETTNLQKALGYALLFRVKQCPN